MKVIGIIGPKAAGKETVAKYLHRKLGGAVYTHSQILDQVLDVLKIPKTRDNEIKLVNLRKIFGPRVLPDALNKKIRDDAPKYAFVTGIRFTSEYENIRSFEKNKIIYVDAPMEARYQRHLERKEKADDSSISFVKFSEMENAETEIYIRELGVQADFRIDNSGLLEDLYKKIDNIIEEICR